MVKEEKQRVSRHKFGQPKYFFLMPKQQKSLNFFSRYVAPLMLTMRTYGIAASSAASKANRDKVKTIICRVPENKARWCLNISCLGLQHQNSEKSYREISANLPQIR